MRVLLIDTCGATGSVAVAETAHTPAIVASASLPGRTAGERLVSTIQHLTYSGQDNLQIAGGLQSLEAVVVVHGPGSFTGVRVGLSAAKALCEALGLPLIAISRLAVLASLAEPDSRRPPAPLLRALFDAGRGEFYSALYADGVCLREALLTRQQIFAEIALAGTEISAPENATPDDAASAARQCEQLSCISTREQIVVACEPAVVNGVASISPQLVVQLVAEPSAADALPLALDRIRRRAFDDIASIDANYLRRTDAEIFAKSTHTPSSVAGSQSSSHASVAQGIGQPAPQLP